MVSSDEITSKLEFKFQKGRGANCDAIVLKINKEPFQCILYAHVGCHCAIMYQTLS